MTYIQTITNPVLGARFKGLQRDLDHHGPPLLLRQNPLKGGSHGAKESAKSLILESYRSGPGGESAYELDPFN